MVCLGKLRIGSRHVEREEKASVLKSCAKLKIGMEGWELSGEMNVLGLYTIVVPKVLVCAKVRYIK